MRTWMLAILFLAAAGTAEAQNSSRNRGAEANKETPAQKIERLRKFSDFDWHQARMSIKPVDQSEYRRGGICGASSLANGVLLWDALKIIDLSEHARRREEPAMTAHRLVIDIVGRGGIGTAGLLAGAKRFVERYIPSEYGAVVETKEFGQIRDELPDIAAMANICILAVRSRTLSRTGGAGASANHSVLLTAAPRIGNYVVNTWGWIVTLVPRESKGMTHWFTDKEGLLTEARKQFVINDKFSVIYIRLTALEEGAE